MFDLQAELQAPHFRENQDIIICSTVTLQHAQSTDENHIYLIMRRSCGVLYRKVILVTSRGRPHGWRFAETYFIVF